MQKIKAILNKYSFLLNHLNIFALKAHKLFNMRIKIITKERNRTFHSLQPHTNIV